MVRLAAAAMGTRFELAIVADNAQAVGELAIREIEDWHSRLSRFEADSWLSHVNRTAASEPVMLDDEVFPLFADALQVWRDSCGAFDIARGSGGDLILDDKARTLKFGRPGISLDLGAIGKGHALDCAAACLRSHGATCALAQGGTSSAIAIGHPPGESGWRIGVAADQDAALFGAVLELTNSAFSLSDESSQPAAPHGRHIVDPRAGTAEPRTHTPRRVLVTGPSARLADAWSTALAVLGEVPSTFPPAYTARFLRK